MQLSNVMIFPALEALQGFRHCFTLRHANIDVRAEREEVIARLSASHATHVQAMGYTADSLWTAEQVHGNEIAVLTETSSREATRGCDGMVSRLTHTVLGIYVADCCAVYLADPVSGAFGVLHSGKKGTEGRITSGAISLMAHHFGSNPADIVVQLSPCIRPPAYETDFAADIRQQALDSGIRVQNLHDSGVCTSSDLAKFYSYRMEKGKTGRMMALLARDE